MAKKTSDKKLKIAIVASETVPYSKTGGLADVTGALAKALADMGHDVHLFTPLYRFIDRKKYKISKGRKTKITIPVSARFETTEVIEIKAEGVKVHFISHEGYFNRDGLYGDKDGDYPDNLERFSFFSRAVLEYACTKKIGFDIFHANDWQSGLLPVYMKTSYADKVKKGSASVLTIHNIGYQGRFSEREWHKTGLDYSLYHPLYLEFYGAINFLKGGITFADKLATVSPTYAKEILSPEESFGMDGSLRERAADLHGVLNGIDTDIWNPKNDPYIKHPYSATNLAGKHKNKKALLKEFSLTGEGEPLFGVVSRIAEQKGLDILLQALPGLLKAGARMILIGTGRDWLEKAYLALAEKYPDKMAVRLVYDERLAHMVEAGADIFVMPSNYEPCGLNQLYSLRYGTLPLVRATGGLNDTVIQFDPATLSGNGFKYNLQRVEALYNKGIEAISLYRGEPDKWKTAMKNAMNENHGWDSSAQKYVEIYRRALSGKK